MRLPFRKKEKKSDAASPYADQIRPLATAELSRCPPTRNSARVLARLTPALLQRIFVYICPHSRDESYETCEKSASDDACMLCDLRNLSHCAQVNRAWRASAITIMYAQPPRRPSSR